MSRSPGHVCRVVVGCAVSLITACQTPGDPTGPADPSPGTHEPDAPAPTSAALYPRHRLNRDELHRTVVDLLGVDSPTIDNLPPDPASSGFKNIASALDMSELYLDTWAAATRDIAERAVRGDAAQDEPTEKRYEAETSHFHHGFRFPTWFLPPLGSDWWALTHTAPERVGVYADVAGAYELRVETCNARVDVHALPGSPQPPGGTLVVSVDWAELGRVEVGSVCTSPQLATFEVVLDSGAHRVTLQFLDATDPAPPPTSLAALSTPALAVDYVELAGPIDDRPRSTGAADALAACQGDLPALRTCLTPFVTRLATHGWRRPVSPAELDDLLGLIEEAQAAGLGPDDALALVVRAVLISPHFLFRLETHTDPADPSDPPGTSPWEAYEVATRLSFFLWRSGPDEALLSCAADGGLQPGDGPCSLSAQADRLLADPRSDSLVSGFLTEWLNLQELDAILRIWADHPTFDQEIAEAMKHEVERSFADLVHSDRPMSALLDGDTTWLNDRLADYYGLPVPGSGADFSRVRLPPGVRGGLLQQGGILTATAMEHRTSPARRAVWMLQTLLCTDVGSPPPGAGMLSEQATTTDPQAALDAHELPACRSCHAILDPLGLSLENYDPVGLWRDQMPDGSPIVVSATLPDGTHVTGPGGLGPALRADPNLEACLVKKVASYATGRELSVRTGPETDLFRGETAAIAAGAKARGGSFRDIVHAIVEHPLFTHRGESP